MKNDVLKRNISKKLVHLRNLKEKSQQEVIFDIGFENLSLRTLQNYELGKVFPSIEKLSILSEYYEVPIDYFLQCDGYNEVYTWNYLLECLNVLIYYNVLTLYDLSCDDFPTGTTLFVSFDKEVDEHILNLKSYVQKIYNESLNGKNIKNSLTVDMFNKEIKKIKNYNSYVLLDQNRIEFLNKCRDPENKILIKYLYDKLKYSTKKE